jgi:hypothetical protein
MSDSKVMQIQILSATPKQLPAKTPGKTYSALELAFKNLTFQGKVEGKNLVGFGNGKAAYDTLLNANPGEVFDISMVKDGAYWNWISATKSNGAAPAPNVSKTSSTTSPTTSPKSTYETPEERAKKQVYIVRQSSISNAVDLLSVGQKSPPAIEAVIEAAKQFEDYVFGTKDTPSDVAGSFFPDSPKPKSDFSDMSDDIPF